MVRSVTIGSVKISGISTARLKPKDYQPAGGFAVQIVAVQGDAAT